MRQLHSDIVLVEGNNELNVQMLPVTEIVNFQLGIKNYPPESYHWQVCVEGGGCWGWGYPDERGGISAPSIAILTITIEEDQPQGYVTIFRETVQGIFEQDHVYDFNCQTLKFEEYKLPVGIETLYIPSPVTSGDEFIPEATWRLGTGGNNRYIPALYIPEEYLPGTSWQKIAIFCSAEFWPFQSRPPADMPGCWKVLDSPNGLYTITGCPGVGEEINGGYRCLWGESCKAQYKVGYRETVLPLPPGIYPIHARIRYSATFGRGEFGAPQGTWELGQVGILEVV